MAKKSSSSLRDFAAQATSERRMYPACETCSRFPEALGDIEEFVKAKRDGDPDFAGIPIAAATGKPSLHLWLQNNYGYDLSGHSLRRHTHICLKNGEES